MPELAAAPALARDEWWSRVYYRDQEVARLRLSRQPPSSASDCRSYSHDGWCIECWNSGPHRVVVDLES
ncbi:MAG: hypothetical protein ACREMA_18805, partial [Longimicrobiales bacterium]